MHSVVWGDLTFQELVNNFVTVERLFFVWKMTSSVNNVDNTPSKVSQFKGVRKPETACHNCQVANNYLRDRRFNLVTFAPAEWFER